MEKIYITSVERQKKNKQRFNIFVDGEYSASLGDEACARFGIKAGAEVEKEKLKEAVAEDNERYAFDLGADMLSFSMRTKKEIAKKLEEKGIEKEAAEAAINKLESYGYLGDEEYAQSYVREAYSSGKSRRAAEYGLREKGIGSALIAEAMKEYTYEMEKEITKKLIETMRKSKDRRQISAALARRGFDFGIISSLLSEE